MKLGFLGFFAGFLVIVLVVAVGALAYFLVTGNTPETNTSQAPIAENTPTPTNNTNPAGANTNTSTGNNVPSTGTTVTTTTTKNTTPTSGGSGTTAVKTPINVDSVASLFSTITDQENLIATSEDDGETSITSQTKAITDASNAYE